MLAAALSGLTGAFFTLIGSVKCGGGAILAPVFAMQLEAISTRYQPALASISLMPAPLASWLRDVPTKHLIFCIGVPELAFGLLSLLSTVAPDKVGSSTVRAANAGMIIFMIGPLTSHWLGDDWTLPMSSNVGPTGIVPAAVITALLSVRLLLSSFKAAPPKAGKTA